MAGPCVVIVALVSAVIAQEETTASVRTIDISLLDDIKFKILFETGLEKVKEQIEVLKDELDSLPTTIVILSVLSVGIIVLFILWYLRKFNGRSPALHLRWCPRPYRDKHFMHEDTDTTMSTDVTGDSGYHISVIDDAEHQYRQNYTNNRGRRSTYQKDLPIELRHKHASGEKKQRRTSLMSIGMDFFDKLPTITRTNWLEAEAGANEESLDTRMRRQKRYSWNEDGTSDSGEVDLYELDNFHEGCLDDPQPPKSVASAYSASSGPSIDIKPVPKLPSLDLSKASSPCAILGVSPNGARKPISPLAIVAPSNKLVALPPVMPGHGPMSKSPVAKQTPLDTIDDDDSDDVFN